MSQPVTQERDVSVAIRRTRYEDDLYTWLLEQVELLRAGRLDEIDADNIAEELADVGASERARLDSILRVLVMHMLKWDQQPDFRTPSWVYSLEEQRRRYAKLMRQNPGLKSYQEEALESMFPIARSWAAAETHFDESEFPATCPYSWDDLLKRPLDIAAPDKGRP